jgi:hypothetical protein
VIPSPRAPRTRFAVRWLPFRSSFGRLFPAEEITRTSTIVVRPTTPTSLGAETKAGDHDGANGADIQSADPHSAADIHSASVDPPSTTMAAPFTYLAGSEQ